MFIAKSQPHRRSPFMGACSLQNRVRTGVPKRAWMRPDHRLNLSGSIPSHPPPQAGCPLGDPGPLPFL